MADLFLICDGSESEVSHRRDIFLHHQLLWTNSTKTMQKDLVSFVWEIGNLRIPSFIILSKCGAYVGKCEETLLNVADAKMKKVGAGTVAK